MPRINELRIALKILVRPQGRLEKLMGDVLRVLALSLGAIWLSEIRYEVEAFRRTLGEYEDVTEEEVEEAVLRLRDLGLIACEHRIRGVLDERQGVPDLLVSIRSRAEVAKVLRRDERTQRYLTLMLLLTSPSDGLEE